MKLIIVTGMSGAGKTVALKMLEDLGYYCVDNLPIPLIEKFTELTIGSPTQSDQVALGIDVRSGQELSLLGQILGSWRSDGVSFSILFLDASDQVLIKRYKETRRNHPLAGKGRIDTGIAKEREKLRFLKEQADVILDTSKLLTKELRQELERIFLGNEDFSNLFVTVLAFGFKYGIPADADLVFDVRFLPNPYYVEGLRTKTGEQKEVQDYVMQGGTAEIFLTKLCEMLDFLIPNYVLEGKNQLVIAIGCTGGKHRSVTIAKALYDYLSQKKELGTKLEYRDIENERI
ncbi:MAG: RNase adapter RapZ [Hungatella sp.]|nr:RNase adapter RapZ [Hungatella sp.]